MVRVIAEFSIIPIGTERTSLSNYVAEALTALKEKGITFTVTPMSTIIEGDSLDDIFNAIKIAHEALIKLGVRRVVISINIDDRLDRPDRKLEDKVKSVKEKMRA